VQAFISSERLKLMKPVIGSLFLYSLLSLSATVAYSCTCSQISHRKEFRQVDAVFSGRVISVAEDKSFIPPRLSVSPNLQKKIDSTRRYIVRFELERRFKGVHGKTVDLYAYQSDMPCMGMIFDVGGRWLVYAYRKPEGLTDGGLCSRTRKLDLRSREYKDLQSFFFKTRARLFF
jgi:hypothetical protein